MERTISFKLKYIVSYKYKTIFNRNHYRNLKILFCKWNYVIFAANNLQIFKTMTVGENKVVSMTYTLREESATGEMIQKVTEDRPFVYLFGIGGLLPSFKANLEGLNAGDDFSFVLKNDQAYGLPSDENIIRLDRKVFEIDGVFDEDAIQVGEVIPMEDEEGYPLTGKILEVDDQNVLVDFNHPLAGLNLYFEGKILDVREATDEELAHGHVHGPHDHHH
jgi:FKBP-type peptidyl-prolyl cis-trans isomerase SlyD